MGEHRRKGTWPTGLQQGVQAENGSSRYRRTGGRARRWCTRDEAPMLRLAQPGGACGPVFSSLEDG